MGAPHCLHLDESSSSSFFINPQLSLFYSPPMGVTARWLLSTPCDQNCLGLKDSLPVTPTATPSGRCFAQVPTESWHAVFDQLGQHDMHNYVEISHTTTWRAEPESAFWCQLYMPKPIQRLFEGMARFKHLCRLGKPKDAPGSSFDISHTTLA